MKYLHIHPKRSILDVQNEFQLYYPYLNLLFFSKSHEQHKPTHSKFGIHNLHTLLEDINPQVPIKKLQLDDNMTAWQLESWIEDHCHIHIQVVKNMANATIMTSNSDDKSLHDLNAEAKQDRTHIPPSTENVDLFEQQ